MIVDFVKFFFTWQNNFYEQIERVAISSPPDLAVTNLITRLEWQALEITRIRFVNGTFLVWEHGTVKLNNFSKYIHNFNSSLQVTMEVETVAAKVALSGILVAQTQTN